MNKITVELNPQEALSFRAWREHQEAFETLLKCGVFGVQNGHAEVHFDPEGLISSVNLHFKVYHRKVINLRDLQ